MVIPTILLANSLQELSFLLEWSDNLKLGERRGWTEFKAFSAREYVLMYKLNTSLPNILKSIVDGGNITGFFG